MCTFVWLSGCLFGWMSGCTESKPVLPIPRETDAERLLPGPTEDGHLYTLALKSELLERQHQAISSAPFGMSLDAEVTDRAGIDAWMAEGSGYTRADLEAFTGEDLYDTVVAYGEMGDLGMFGGVAAVADAWRWGLLRQGASAEMEEMDRALSRLEQLMDSLHAMQAVTGRPGSLVRGLGAADMPGMESVELVPLNDEDGAPLPASKSAVWRADQSGEYPTLYWYDDTSKDQWIGYILALSAVWEVASEDPMVDPARMAALRSDALAMGQALQLPSPDTGLDLTLIDGDGRPTTFHDLNANELEGVVLDAPFNPFNALLALAGLRVLADVSGDADLMSFYEEVADDRGYAALSEDVGTFVYLGYLTNYSNVNMGFTALYSLLRHEQDRGRRGHYLEALRGLWAEGDDRAPWHFHNAWFSYLYASQVAVEDTIVAEATENLLEAHEAPYWDDPVENCDPEEVSAGVCIAVDGTTEIRLHGAWVDGVFVPESARNADLVAESYLPQRVRPPDNFAWRSDPYAVNGGGGTRLNPGGDLRAAYWAGRWLSRAK